MLFCFMVVLADEDKIPYPDAECNGRRQRLTFGARRYTMKEPWGAK